MLARNKLHVIYNVCVWGSLLGLHTAHVWGSLLGLHTAPVWGSLLGLHTAHVWGSLLGLHTAHVWGFVLSYTCMYFLGKLCFQPNDTLLTRKLSCSNIIYNKLNSCLQLHSEKTCSRCTLNDITLLAWGIPQLYLTNLGFDSCRGEGSCSSRGNITLRGRREEVGGSRVRGGPSPCCRV